VTGWVHGLVQVGPMGGSRVHDCLLVSPHRSQACSEIGLPWQIYT